MLRRCQTRSRRRNLALLFVQRWLGHLLGERRIRAWPIGKRISTGLSVRVNSISWSILGKDAASKHGGTTFSYSPTLDNCNSFVSHGAIATQATSMLCGSISSWFLSIGPSQMSKLASFLSFQRVDPGMRATYKRRVHCLSHRHGVDPTASIPSRNSPCNRSWCDGRARSHLDPPVSFTWLPRDSVSVGAPPAFDPKTV